MVQLVAAGTISVRSVPEVIASSFESGQPPAQIVEERGLAQVSDTAALAAIVAEALDANPKSVADYLGGKQAAAKFLVGQVMRATRGKANPRTANELIVEALEARRAKLTRADYISESASHSLVIAVKLTPMRHCRESGYDGWARCSAPGQSYATMVRSSVGVARCRGLSRPCSTTCACN